MAVAGAEIVNLNQFRRDLRLAEEASPRELTAAIKEVGAPIARLAGEHASRSSRTGRLARSYSVRASGTSGRLISRVPYGAGAEWGQGGHWRGFNRYGPPGRFAWRATQELSDEIVTVMTEKLKDLITLHGWAVPV